MLDEQAARRREGGERNQDVDVGELAHAGVLALIGHERGALQQQGRQPRLLEGRHHRHRLGEQEMVTGPRVAVNALEQLEEFVVAAERDEVVA